jgi:methylmalonyl-CoA carboxyltransferase large subunit
MKDKICELRKRKEKVYRGGGEKGIKRQHDQGKLTARERLGAFLDPDTFQEMNIFSEHRCVDFGMMNKNLPCDGVVTGVGQVDGKLVSVVSQDFSVAGGAVGETTAKKITTVMKEAQKCGTPFIFINDSGGARIQEGVDSLSGYGKIFFYNVILSGVVPQISIIAGPCAGGAAYAPALTDFIIQTRMAKMFITGPSVIKQVTGEDVTSEQLGGVEAQMNYSGVVHFVAENDEEAMLIARRLLSFLPSNNLVNPPLLPFDPEQCPGYDERLNKILPDDPKTPYDMRDIIYNIVDCGDFMEVQDHFAENIIVGFGRFAGRTAGIIANQPKHCAGVLDIDSSDKSARFIRFCNAFNIPLVTLVDVPGFMPGVKQEYSGIIRHGAKMLFAYSAATVPKVTVIIKKAYGGAYLAMCGKDLGADRVAAWPTAEIAVMGAEGAADVIFRKEIAAASDPAAERERLLEQYREKFYNPFAAASRGLVDDVIEPAETRAYIITALDSLQNKRDVRPHKKHGLIPL